MSELTDFLLARIAEDEASGKAYWRDARRDAECEAKRRIVEAWQKAHGPQRDTRWGRDVRVGSTYALWHLATIYADHPDYREEWRP